MSRPKSSDVDLWVIRVECPVCQKECNPFHDKCWECRINLKNNPSGDLELAWKLQLSKASRGCKVFSVGIGKKYAEMFLGFIANKGISEIWKYEKSGSAHSDTVVYKFYMY